jgi:hypothetical protein
MKKLMAALTAVGILASGGAALAGEAKGKSKCATDAAVKKGCVEKWTACRKDDNKTLKQCKTEWKACCNPS